MQLRSASFGALAVLGVAAMALFLAVDRGANGINEAVSARWLNSAAELTVASFIWHVTIRPSIVVEPWGLRVRNPFFIHQLPWEAITGCGVSPSGAMTIATTTGTVNPFTYAGSVAAALGGARSARSALRVIEEARSAGEPGADPSALVPTSGRWITQSVGRSGDRRVSGSSRRGVAGRRGRVGPRWACRLGGRGRRRRR
jgi:hypothetical protein